MINDGGGMSVCSLLIGEGGFVNWEGEMCERVEITDWRLIRSCIYAHQTN